MNKSNFLFEALKESIRYKDINWLISLLSYVKDDNIRAMEAYDIYYRDDGTYYKNEDGEIVRIEDAPLGEKLFERNEKIDLPPGILVNAPNGCKETTVGRILQNQVMLCWPFGNKIPYINNRFMPKDIEKGYLLEKLTDTPPEGAPREDNLIYVDEYINFCDACIYLSQLTQTCVPGVTEKAITPPPNAKEYLDKLLEEHKDHLDDPVVIAEIGKKMSALDKAYLKGDRSLGFLISPKKDFEVVRKKMYLFYGFDKTFDDDDTKVNFIKTPLIDGIEWDKLDNYINGGRIGSFSRGAETQLGGVAFKELIRASSNAHIVEEDCGTTLGLPVFLNEQYAKTYKNFYIIVNGKSILLDDKTIPQYLNKEVIVRSPAYCKSSGNGLCSHCCGPYLSLHEKGLSTAVSAMGSTFLYTFMKAMHGKVLATAELDLDKLIS